MFPFSRDTEKQDRKASRFEPNDDVTIREFTEGDGPQVRDLFIVTNRLLSPPHLRDAFEVYIERALAEEIDRIAAYYQEHDGDFWARCG